jgi:hypothetical protein
MGQQRKPETEVERSRRLREEAAEAQARLGKVAHDLLELQAAKQRKLAAEAEELRARIRGHSQPKER